MTDSSQTWQWWVTTAIAIAALAQPWVIQLWNRFIVKATLVSIPSGKIELTFNAVEGPRIGLVGVFQASKPLIVAKCEANVIKEDGSTRTFDAQAFRIRNDNGTERTTFPTAFGVKADSLELYNILFSSQTFTEEATRLMTLVSQQWGRVLTSQSATLAVRSTLPGTVPQARTTEERQQETQRLFNNFTSDSTYVSVLRQMESLLFWTAGNYKMSFKQYSQNGSERFVTLWNTKLSAEKAADMRSKLPALIQAWCMQQLYTIIALAEYVPEHPA